MGSGRRPFEGCVVGIGLMIMAGCSPGSHISSGMEGQGSPPAVTQKAVAKAAETSVKGRETKGPAPEVRSTSSLQPSTPGPGGYRMAGDDPVVKERVTLFEKKKGEWDETARRLASVDAGKACPSSWYECLQDIEAALVGYRSLAAGQGRDLNPWTIIRRDMNYFEKGCDQVLAEVQTKVPGGPGAGAPPLSVEGSVEPIRQHFEAGQYEEAVALYETLAKSEDTATIPQEARLYCSRALVRLGRFQEAATLLTEWLRQAGQTTDLAAFETRRLTADVLLAAGQVDEARQIYVGLAKALAPVVSQQEWAAAHAQAFGEQISEQDLARYEGLIRDYLRFDGKHVPQELIDGAAQLQGEAAGPLAEMAKMVLAKAMAEAQAWARAQLVEVRGLIASHELIRARVLVDQVSLTAPVEMRSVISQLQEEIARAEALSQETATSGGEVALSPWEEALHLFEQQRYDEAIGAFQKLVDGEHGAEAKTKISAAIEYAATALRQQAAALYAKAKKTFDPEAKRQTLLSSRSLLVKLIEKYPESSIVVKARQNLKVLDAELGETKPAPPPLSAPADDGDPDFP